MEGNLEPNLGPNLETALIPEPFAESTFVTPESILEPSVTPVNLLQTLEHAVYPELAVASEQTLEPSLEPGSLEGILQPGPESLLKPHCCDVRISAGVGF